MRIESKKQDKAPEVDDRKTYVQPVLQAVGNVRDLTLGATPGIGDSLTPTVRQP